MTALLLSLIAPALWAASNHFNKILVSRVLPSAGIGAIIIFAALVGVVVLLVSFFLQHDAFSIGLTNALMIALNGCIYLLALIPFLKALRISDASTIIPILQTIPVISFVLARIFLGEILTPNQIIGGVMILAGAVLISIEVTSDTNKTKLALRADALSLMLLSAFLYSLSFLLFKALALQSKFWTTAFWESVGFIFYAAMMIACVRSYRTDFFSVLLRNRKATALIMSNEVLNIVAKVVFNYVSLLIPITLAWLGVGFQSVFVLLYSMVLAKFFPHLSNEAVKGRQLLQRGAAIVIMVAGALVMYT